MITLIGTGHVFNLRDALLHQMDNIMPEVICVELDIQRYQAMLMKQTQPEKYEQARKRLPFIYRLLGRFQENMADEYGVIPGEEMLTAVRYGQEHQLPVEFIDVNAQQIFSEMLRQMTIRERFQLFLSGFAGLFISKKRVEDELQRYQDDFTSYLDEISKKYPTIKKVLIDQRNEYMVNHLGKLAERYVRIVACVGDGHIPGMLDLLHEQGLNVTSIRLKQLQEYTSSPQETSQSHFSTVYSVDDTENNE